MVENTVLAPGHYVWRRLRSLSDHNIVQITDENTHRVAATVLAITSYRSDTPLKDEVDFWETPSGSPRAIRAWFSSGDNYGQEFPYPAKLINYRRVVTPAPQLLERSARASAAPVQKLESFKKPVLANPVTKDEVSAKTPGSWAVIGDTTPDARQKPTLLHKRPGTIWDALARLPLTATLAPLIGLIGLVSLGLYALSYRKRRKQQSVTSQPGF